MCTTARRLRRIKAALLNHVERTWIDGVIDDTENALRAVAQLIEPARIDKSTKQGISIGSRIMWLFRDSPKVRDKHVRLSMCHQSLSSVIACFYSKDVVIVAPLPEKKLQERPPPYDPQMEQLFNWRNRRLRGRSSSSIDGKVGERPKLPGSIPTDTNDNSSMGRCAYLSGIAEDTKPADKLVDNLSNPFASLTTNEIQVTGFPGWDPNDDATGTTKQQMFSVTSPTSVPATHQSMEPFSIRQSRTNEETTNSRLPYPMSPSDYSTISTADSSLGSYDSCSVSASSSSVSQVPSFREQMPTPKPELGPLSIHSTPWPDFSQKDPPFESPGSMSVPTEIESSLFFRSPSFNSFDGADGPQVVTQSTRSDYRHHTDFSPPPFYSQASASRHPLPTNSTHTAKFGSTPELSRELSSPPSHAIAELGATDHTNHSGEQGHQSGASVVHQPSSTQEPKRYPSYASSQGSVRRGGRSWLMFHASRSDFGHYGG